MLPLIMRMTTMALPSREDSVTIISAGRGLAATINSAFESEEGKHRALPSHEATEKSFSYAMGMRPTTRS
jgi:hypothetical protein